MELHFFKLYLDKENCLLSSYLTVLGTFLSPESLNPTLQRILEAGFNLHFIAEETDQTNTSVSDFSVSVPMGISIMLYKCYS